MVLHEPDRIETHLVGEEALLKGLLDDGVVVDHRALHLVGEAQSHQLSSANRRIDRSASSVSSPGTAISSITRW